MVYLKDTYKLHMGVRNAIWPGLKDADYNQYRGEAENSRIGVASKVRADKRHWQQRRMRIR